MTLVVATTIGDTPVLFGDLLGSRESSTAHEMPVPTASVQRLNEIAPKHAFVLVEKIVVVSPSLAVAWSGDRPIAMDVLKGLKTAFGKNDVDPTKLQEHLALTQVGTGLRCQLVGWVQDTAGMTAMSWDSASRHELQTGSFFAAGSGARTFRSMLSNSRGRTFGPEHGCDAAFGTALSWTGALLADELASGKNLAEEGYGAGYQVYCFDGDTFRTTDVTYVSWLLRANPGRPPYVPLGLKLLLKYSTTEGHVVAQVWSLQRGPEGQVRAPAGMREGGSAQVAKRELFGAWRATEKTDPPPNIADEKSFHSRYMVHLVTVVGRNNQSMPNALVTDGREGNPYLRFVEPGPGYDGGLAASRDLERLIRFASYEAGLRVTGLYPLLFGTGTKKKKLQKILRDHPGLVDELEAIAVYLDVEAKSKGFDAFHAEAQRFREARARLSEASLLR